MNIHDKSRYREEYARSLADPEGFWGEAAREIDWIEPAKKIFDSSIGLYGRWFAGAVVTSKRPRLLAICDRATCNLRIVPGSPEDGAQLRTVTFYFYLVRLGRPSRRLLGAKCPNCRSNRDRP